MKILLDMDGVLVDFVAGICKWFNKPYPYDLPESKGVWDVDRLLGIRPEEFEFCLNNARFWRELLWTNDGTKIFNAAYKCAGEENMFLITNPDGASYRYLGKADWVRKNLGHLWLDRTIMVKDKSLLAGPGRVLIDDKDSNVDDFLANGGEALLINRPWNELHSIAASPVCRVKAFLEHLRRKVAMK